MQSNPYQPRIATDLPEETTTNSGELRPAGFWIRTLAVLIDIAVTAPVSYWNLTFIKPSISAWPAPTLIAAFLIPALVFDVYYLVGHRYWGKTVGKFLCRITVVRAPGDAPMNWRASIMRVLPATILNHVSVWLLYATTVQNLAEHSGAALATALQSGAHQGDTLVQVAFGIWGLGSIAVLLSNPLKRTLHDYIAGTRVKRDPPR